VVGNLNSEFIVNLPPSLAVKEFRKSVNVWGSYGKSLMPKQVGNFIAIG